MTWTSACTSKTSWTNCLPDARTSTVYYLTSGSKATRRQFVSIESKNGATKPSASNTSPQTGGSLPASVARSTRSPPHMVLLSAYPRRSDKHAAISS